MSKATKRKHVLNEALQDDYDPPSERQSIVRIVSSKGNNLHEVETADSETYLVSMPTKFRKNIWVKRGDYIIVEPIDEGDKVKAEMVRVLSKEHVKHFRKLNVWPGKFDRPPEEERSATVEEPPVSTTDTSGSSSDEAG